MGVAWSGRLDIQPVPESITPFGLPSHKCASHQREDPLTCVTGPHTWRPSVELEFEPETLRHRSRDHSLPQAKGGEPFGGEFAALAYSGRYVLSVRLENSALQVVSLTAVAIATGYVREDPFRIRGIRRKSGFYFILGASLWLQKEYIIRELLPTENGLLLR
ncbi:hypothetical protein AVEN_129952-1 [Araneus ventricosus]|uniref:Uncharacterized protein n=1 Tax=Araneus ventricosus TaxID=182803 RepID=A0A4Y2NQX0_ARAVE|nr:hypothetical protein AVEN_129952-1 [Araneus ventricosus]